MSVAADAARRVARALLVAPALVFAYWATVAGLRRWRNDAYWAHFPPSFGCDDTKLLGNCELEQLAYFFAAPAVAAAAALALLALAAAASPKTPTTPSPPSLLARLAALQLPPRRLWAWWCGGLSGADALAVGAWLALNATWIVAILSRYQKLLPMFEKLSRTPTLQLELELVAVALGSLLFPSLVLLFLPVARGSVLLMASGLSYPAAIRYHRWLGHAVMAIATAHSLAFWGVWLWQGEWVHEAFARGARINNLAGGVSFVGGAALWLSSVDAARRASYGLFYALHHIGFWLFFAAGVAHYSGMAWYFLPGMLFYAIDGVYRLNQAAHDLAGGGGGGNNAVGSPGGATLLAAQASSGGQEDGKDVNSGDAAAVVALTLAGDAFAAASTGNVWLSVPAISALQWHPFEYVSVSRRGHGGGRKHNGNHPRPPTLLLHIKAYDRWTRRLAALVAERGGAGGGNGAALPPSSLRVQIEGPYGEPPRFERRSEDAMILVAGGIGAAAALALLSELPPAGSGPGAPRRGLLIWSARSAHEFALLAPRVLGLAAERGLALDVELFFTGGGGADDASPLELLVTPAAPPLAPHAATSAVCPVLALGTLGAQMTHKAVVHALVFGCALAALLAVRAWGSLVGADGEPSPRTTAEIGLATVFGVGAAAVLPAALLLRGGALDLGAAALRRWRRTGRGGSGGGGDGATDVASVSVASHPLLLDVDGDDDGDDEDGGDGIEGGGDDEFYALAEPARLVAAGGGAAAAAAATMASPSRGGHHHHQLRLPVQRGRPPLERRVASWLALLRDAPAAADGDAATARQLQVGVYAMGPRALSAAARLLCDDANRGATAKASRCYLRFEQRTHEL